MDAAGFARAARLAGYVAGRHAASREARLVAGRHASQAGGGDPALITETGMLPGDPEELRRQIPVRRLGLPEEVADLALAILRNAYLTNQVISLDGGIHPR